MILDPLDDTCARGRVPGGERLVGWKVEEPERAQ